jgi:hypothetical protein
MGRACILEKFRKQKETCLERKQTHKKFSAVVAK